MSLASLGRLAFCLALSKVAFSEEVGDAHPLRGVAEGAGGAAALAAANPSSSPGLRVDASRLVISTNGTDASDALLAIYREVDRQMRVHAMQPVIALVCLAVGGCMLYDGLRCFKTVAVIGVFDTLYVLSMAELHAAVPELRDQVTVWQVFVAVEVAVVGAAAAWQGFEGVQLIMGAALGGGATRLVQLLIALMDQHTSQLPWVLVVIGTACVAAGVWLFRSDRLEAILANLLPLLGGKLVSTSLAFGLWKAFSLTEPGAAVVDWVDTWANTDIVRPVSAALGHGNYDYPGKGLLAETMGNGAFDKALGFVLWLLATVGGIVWQRRQIDKRRKSRSSVKFTDATRPFAPKFTLE